MKISVIVPVFNSEKYLEKCLDSIINQSIGFENIELIIINDGSIDNSQKIIEKYANKYKNIISFYQKNSGQASARNKGIEKSTGEYISFIDSDDYIAKDMLNELYNISKIENLDIVTCAISKVTNNKIYQIKEKLSNDENRNYILTKTGPCNMLIKKDIIDKYKFRFPTKLRKYEDIAIVPLLGMKNIKIKYIDKALYYYYDNEDSVMNPNNYTKKMHDIFTSMDMLLKSAKEEKTYNLYKDEIEYLFIRHLIMSAGLRYIRFNDPENKIQEIKAYMQTNFPNWKKNPYYINTSLKYKITAILIVNNMKKIIKIIDKIRKK